jgi:hypothetical protein
MDGGLWESGLMAQTVSILLGDEDRKRLEAIASDRSRPLKHFQRAKIVLYSAERLPVLEIARRAGVSRPAVWRWQQRYAEEGTMASCATRPTSRFARRCRRRSSPDSEVDLRRAAGRRDPSERAHHGEGCRDFLAGRAAALGEASAPAATPPNLQALE